ncbi:hypothetical protein [uncultured Deinococcus sp.]|uniref:hypothetical protein n=1 Tax=uncultured Deinococcus sp. TaxID=158789 RepID=UPI00258A0A9C|nr:hypothetical protein [uncultured Deinococcus sp.]
MPAQAATSPALSDGIAAAFALLNPQPDPSTVAAQSDAATAADPAQVEAAHTELATARTEIEKLKAERRELELRKQLDGKVSDVGAALKLLDPERHVLDSGKVNLNRLWDDFPSLLRPNTTHTTAPNPGGGIHTPYGGGSLERALEHGSTAEVNYAFDYELNKGRR